MSVLSIGLGIGLGFAAGLFTFKLKSRWCPQCGAMTLPAPPEAKP
jgi:hypothetical protein